MQYLRTLIYYQENNMFHDLADRVRAGETLVGTWLYLSDVGVAEVVAGAGFDFVIVDMEHSPTGFENLRKLDHGS